MFAFDADSYAFISRLVHANTLPKMAYVHQTFDSQKIDERGIACAVVPEGNPEATFVGQTGRDGCDYCRISAGAQSFADRQDVG